MNERTSMAAAMVLDLRTPLARLSLAAQRQAREAARPSDQALAQGMQDTVLEIDAQIDRILPLLEPKTGSAAPSRRAAGPILAALVDRLRPSLEAQGIGLELAEPEPTIEIDPHAARRIAATLIDAGTGWVGEAGQLELSLQPGPGLALALALDCTRHGPDPGSAPTPTQFVVTPELQALGEHVGLYPQTAGSLRIAVGLGDGA